MNTLESMAARYRELFGIKLNKTELSIILTDFTVEMMQKAHEDKNYSLSLAICEYSDKVKNAEAAFLKL